LKLSTIRRRSFQDLTSPDSKLFGPLKEFWGVTGFQMMTKWMKPCKTGSTIRKVFYIKYKKTSWPLD
jgi:hypothetical protein